MKTLIISLIVVIALYLVLGAVVYLFFQTLTGDSFSWKELGFFMIAWPKLVFKGI